MNYYVIIVHQVNDETLGRFTWLVSLCSDVKS